MFSDDILRHVYYHCVIKTRLMTRKDSRIPTGLGHYFIYGLIKFYVQLNFVKRSVFRRISLIMYLVFSLFELFTCRWFYSLIVVFYLLSLYNFCLLIGFRFIDLRYRFKCLLNSMSFYLIKKLNTKRGKAMK